MSNNKNKSSNREPTPALESDAGRPAPKSPGSVEFAESPVKGNIRVSNTLPPPPPKPKSKPKQGK